MRVLEKIFFTILLVFAPLLTISGQSKPEQKIFVFGGDIHPKFVQYVAELTGVDKPRICYVPTASADNADNIKYWNVITERLPIEPHVLKVWVNSKYDSIPFEQTLLNMDAIIVGGGNTLNMMGIWKAQGIDKIMQKALGKGIILSGGSAGSICWFVNGLSDSRPQNLSIVEGLGFLPYSNCPHYGDKEKEQVYHDLLMQSEIKAGYASDDLSGILFTDGKFTESVSVNELNDSYYVSVEKGNIKAEKLDSRILINKDALPESDYTVIDINKTIHEAAKNNNDILNAFESFIREVTKEEKLEKTLSDTRINKIFIYNDQLATVVNKREYDFYCMSYFYKQPNGQWKSMGEDIADTIKGAEISFRERAMMHLERSKKLGSS